MGSVTRLAAWPKSSTPQQVAAAEAAAKAVASETPKAVAKPRGVKRANAPEAPAPDAGDGSEQSPADPPAAPPAEE